MLLGPLPSFLKGQHVLIFPCDCRIVATKVTARWQGRTDLEEGD